MANKVGVSQATVSNWERGEASPNDDQLRTLKSFLGTVKDIDTSNDEDGDSLTEVSPFGVWLNTTRTKKGLTVIELGNKARVVNKGSSLIRGRESFLWLDRRAAFLQALPFEDEAYQ